MGNELSQAQAKDIDESLGFKSEPIEEPTLERTDTFIPDKEDCEIIGTPCYINKYVKLGDNVIGSGTFGEVRIAYDEMTKEYYAVKIIDKMKLSSDKLDSISKETSIMMSLRHPNIVKYIFSKEDDRYIKIYMERFDRDLFDLVRNVRLNECKLYLIFKQIVDAVSYIHKLGIVHRDIKLENVLYNEDGHVALTDFGLATRWSIDDEPMTENRGSPEYSSPQVASRNPYNGFKSDIWSLGVLLYVMAVGRYPFNGGRSITTLQRNITSGKYDDLMIRNEDLRDLIKSMLTVDEDERYDIDGVINSVWMKKWHEKIEEYKDCETVAKEMSKVYSMGKTLGKF